MQRNPQAEIYHIVYITLRFLRERHHHKRRLCVFAHWSIIRVNLRDPIGIAAIGVISALWKKKKTFTQNTHIANKKTCMIDTCGGVRNTSANPNIHGIYNNIIMMERILWNDSCHQWRIGMQTFGWVKFVQILAVGITVKNWPIDESINETKNIIEILNTAERKKPQVTNMHGRIFESTRKKKELDKNQIDRNVISCHTSLFMYTCEIFEIEYSKYIIIIINRQKKKKTLTMFILFIGVGPPFFLSLFVICQLGLAENTQMDMGCVRWEYTYVRVCIAHNHSQINKSFIHIRIYICRPDSRKCVVQMI